MDLPKNITQIGVADAKCKIYVEDYVVSFLKQLNPIARDKTMAAALYGRKKTEEDKTYLFAYGAGKLNFIQKETRHLSQAQLQEIERIRRQYFKDYEFLGYRILDGEMVDGFYVYDQEVCRYVSGYAQFYENNESMLTYMLESRQGDAVPESVDSEKYEMVRDRQEKRRAKFVQHKKEQEKEEAEEKRSLGAKKFGIQATAVTLLVLFLMLGIVMNTSLMEKGSMEWERLKEEFLERKLPGEVGETPDLEAKAEILKADDKLTEAVRTENKKEEKKEEILPVSGNVVVDGTSTEKGTEGKEKLNGEDKKSAGASTSVAEQKQEGQQKAEGQKQEDQQKAEGQKQEDQQKAEEQKQEDQQKAEGQKQEDQQKAEGQKQEDQQKAEGQKQEDQQKAEGKKEGDGQKTQTAVIDQAKSYTVCKGDTLNGICFRIYGNINYVKTICQINNIANPDEIQIGQKILLP